MLQATTSEEINVRHFGARSNTLAYQKDHQAGETAYSLLHNGGAFVTLSDETQFSEVALSTEVASSRSLLPCLEQCHNKGVPIFLRGSLPLEPLDDKYMGLSVQLQTSFGLKRASLSSHYSLVYMLP